MSAPFLLDGLSSRQRIAVNSLCSGRRHDQAAADAGVTSRTIRRWLGQSPFAAELRRAQDSMFGDALSRLARAAPSAVSVAANLMVDPEQTAALRLKAAQVIMLHSLAMRDDDVVRRLSTLEAKLGIATTKQNAA